MTSLLRLVGSARTLASLVLLAGVAWACEGTDPGAPVSPDALEISLAVAGAEDGPAAQSLGEAFDRADNLRVQVLIPGRDPIVEVFDFTPGGDEIRARVSVPIPQGVTTATIIVELRLGEQVLFRAVREVTLGGDGDFQLDLELEPAPGRIELGTPWTLTTLGAPAQLDGAVLFVTGEEIPDAPLVWSTEATGIEITPDGVVTALRNGTYTVLATSGDLSATGEVRVTAEAAIASIAPSPVVLGQPTDLVVQGSNLLGATAVTPCGTATVDPAGPTVSADGTLLEVRVTWSVLDDTGALQEGQRCVRVSTPQGDAEGSVELVEPPAASLALSPESAGLAPGSTLQLETEVRDDQGNLLSDRQVSFTSDRPDVASVDGDGLVTAHAPGTAVVTATAGVATASSTITVGGGVVRGTVTADGEPVEGVTVTLSGPGGETTTATDPAGAYAFEGVVPGSHTVSISDIPAAYRFPTTSRTVEIVSTETVTADFAGTAAPGTVTGTVTVDGSPAARLTVTLTGGSRFFQERTDEAGVYLFDEVPTGSYTLAVSPGQGAVFDPPSVEVTVESGGTTGFDFAGRSVGEVGGTVTLDDEGAAGVTVTVADSDGGTTTTTTDGAGQYLFPTVPTGTATVTISGFPEGATFPVVSKTVEVPHDATVTVDFAGTAGVDVALTKTVDDETPNEGETVVFTVTASNLGSSDATGVTVSDQLPAGLTFVSATPSVGTYDPGTGDWTVGGLPAGATETLTLEATVDAGTRLQTLTNTATVAAVDQADSDGTNDSASASVTVHDVPQAAAYGTAGNTELVAGGYLVPTTPHHTDPDGVLSTTPTLTVTSLGPFASAQGGTVTMRDDGAFSYVPPPGFSGTDMFTYTVDAGTSATVEITFTGMVWYVDNTAGTTGTGVSDDPFDATSDAFAATADGDGAIVYVDRGDGTSSGYLDTSLRTGQSLVGEGVALTVAGVGTLAPAGTAPVLSGGVEGVAVTLADGATVEGVDVAIPPFGIGLAAFSLTGGVTVDQVTVTGDGTGNTGVYLSNTTGTYTFTGLDVSGSSASAITVTGGSPTVSFGIAAGSVSVTAGRPLEVLNTTGGSVTFTGGPITSNGGGGVLVDGNAGTVEVHNPVTITNPTAVAVMVRNNTALVTLDDLDITTTGPIGVFVRDNTMAVTLGGTVDVTGATALSLGRSVVNAAFTSVSVDNTGAPRRGVVVFDVTGTTEIGLLDVVTDGFTGVSLVDSGIFRVTDATSRISTTGADGLNALAQTGSVVLDMVLGDLTVNPANHGVSIGGADGTLAVAGGSITDPGSTSGSGEGFIVNAGTVDVTYGGSISNTIEPNARSVRVSSHAGTTTFSGPITDQGAGISLTSNTGTVNFTGGLALDATTASAFSATGGGTVNVTGTGNTVSTISGRGIEIDGTTIGADGVTFESVSASAGAFNAIRLNNTGTTGLFKVTGDGVNPGSGGTISGTTSHAVWLTGAHGVTLDYLDISGGGGSGVRADNSSDVAIRNSTVTSTPSGLQLFGLTGTSAITSTVVSGTTGGSNATVTTTAGTLTLDLTGSSFSSSASTSGAGFVVNTSGTANATLLADGTSAIGNTGNGFFGFARDQSTLEITVRNASSFDGNAANGFEVDLDNDGTITLDVRNSTFSTNSDAGVSLLTRGTSTASAGLSGTLDSNTITDNQPSTTGVGGIETRLSGAAKSVLAVTNNSVTQTPNANGVSFLAGVSSTDTGSLDLLFDGNTVTHGSITSGDPLTTATIGGTTLCLSLGPVTNSNAVTVGIGTGVVATNDDTGGATFNVEELGNYLGGMAELIRDKVDITVLGDATDVSTSGAFTAVAAGACQRP